MKRILLLQTLTIFFISISFGQINGIKSIGTANEKGNGIGLMLCKEFAIRNGGDIWMQSEQGVGTTFYYSIPNAAQKEGY